MRLSRFQNISYIIKEKHLKISIQRCKNKVRGKIKGRKKLDRLVITVRLSQPLRTTQRLSTTQLLFFKGVEFTDTKFEVVFRSQLRLAKATYLKLLQQRFLLMNMYAVLYKALYQLQEYQYEHTPITSSPQLQQLVELVLYYKLLRAGTLSAVMPCHKDHGMTLPLLPYQLY